MSNKEITIRLRKIYSTNVAIFQGLSSVRSINIVDCDKNELHKNFWPQISYYILNRPEIQKAKHDFLLRLPYHSGYYDFIKKRNKVVVQFDGEIGCIVEADAKN